MIKLMSFIKKIWGYIARIQILDSFLFQWSLGELKRLQDDENVDEVTDVVDTAFDYSGYGVYKTIQPQQKKSEWVKVLEKARRRSPQTVLEIGTGQGGSLYSICRSLRTVETIITVDLPPGKTGLRYPKQKENFFHEFSEKNLHIIRGDSQRKTTRDKVNGVLEGRTLDLLIIDGDHSYQGVKKDFESYIDLTSSDAMIVFDDVFTHKREEFEKDSHGVIDFWKEIKSEYEHEEIVEPDGRSKGIGVIHK